MEKAVFHWPEKQFLLGVMNFFCKNWLPHNFNNGKKNTIILKNSISPRQKRILQRLFQLVETIIEIRKNPIF